MQNKERKNEKTFSSTEVGTLIEDLKSNFNVVSEGQISLRKNMDDVKNRLSVVETEVRSLKDVVRVAIPSLATRVSVLETKVGV